MAKKKALRTNATDGGKSVDELFDGVIAEILVENADYMRVGPFKRKTDRVPCGKSILMRGRDNSDLIVNSALDRIEDLEERAAAFAASRRKSLDFQKIWTPRLVLVEVLRLLLRRKLPLEEQTTVRLITWPTEGAGEFNPFVYPFRGLASAAEHYVEMHGVSEALRRALEALSHRLRHIDWPMAHPKEWRETADRLQVLLVSDPQIKIQPDETWSDAALADLAGMTSKQRQAWNNLLNHCQKGGSKKITPRWQKEAEPLIAAVGWETLKKYLLRWFPLVDKPRTQPIESDRHWMEDFEWIAHVGSIGNFEHLIIPSHVEILRGLAWCAGLHENADLARALTHLAISAYRKIPSKGPRLVSLGNACVTALGRMPGLPPIGQLAILKVKVKFGTAQKEIEKAFNSSAARENLPREEIEELAVPAYGLEGVGSLRQSFGEYQAELTVDGSSTALHWLKEDKPIKSVPAAVKKEHAAELKELQMAVKDINAMLPAQRERLDTLFLSQKTWPLNIWRERYLNHPLIGTIARRLLWSFTSKSRTIDGIWHGGDLLGLNGKPLNLKSDATVALWHPIGHAMEEVLAWREWLERREVIQPFKQAHREIYLLTDAERRTGTYSNRFAAHVLRQHQFHALCAARSWKNRLRLAVDDSYPPPHRLLPNWGLRAEFWIEGIGGDHGSDINQSGAFLYLATDQVRFYRIDAEQLYAHASGGGYVRWGRENDEPLALETIPALVFSEILRDVDLFVGVASVGNDPNWSDGGPDGRYRDYWQSYSFGELSATAQTRRALLERLLPRLKIAERCSLADRFLIVRGSLRTYKIHLGSGNILMSPNDQYLCIVPRQTTAGQERVLLPFEGDGTLSVILSKAFLLAEDQNITDLSILSQLKT